MNCFYMIMKNLNINGQIVGSTSHYCPFGVFQIQKNQFLLMSKFKPLLP